MASAGLEQQPNHCRCASFDFNPSSSTLSSYRDLLKPLQSASKSPRPQPATLCKLDECKTRRIFQTSSNKEDVQSKAYSPCFSASTLPKLHGRYSPSAARLTGDKASDSPIRSGRYCLLSTIAYTVRCCCSLRNLFPIFHVYSVRSW